MYAPGDKSKAICYYCASIQATTFKERDLLTPGGVVPAVLVSVCDICDSTVGIPQQSLAKVVEVCQDD